MKNTGKKKSSKITFKTHSKHKLSSKEEKREMMNQQNTRKVLDSNQWSR